MCRLLTFVFVAIDENEKSRSISASRRCVRVARQIVLSVPNNYEISVTKNVTMLQCRTNKDTWRQAALNVLEREEMGGEGERKAGALAPAEKRSYNWVGIYVSSAYPIACEMQPNGVGVDYP